MTPDERLKLALGLGADEPPAVDPIFTARIAERIERRRLALRLAAAALWATAGAVLIGTLSPVLAEGVAALEGLTAPVTAAVVTAGAAWLVGRAGPAAFGRQIMRTVGLSRR